jgi:hypothetical protein
MCIPSLGLVRARYPGFYLLVGLRSSPDPGDRVLPGPTRPRSGQRRPEAERALISAHRPLTVKGGELAARPEAGNGRSVSGCRVPGAASAGRGHSISRWTFGFRMSMVRKNPGAILLGR